MASAIGRRRSAATTKTATRTRKAVLIAGESHPALPIAPREQAAAPEQPRADHGEEEREAGVDVVEPEAQRRRGLAPEECDVAQAGGEGGQQQRPEAERGHENHGTAAAARCGLVEDVEGDMLAECH